MSTAAQPFPANVPLVDEAGTISPVWLRFFLSMWTRTGSAGAGGIIIPDTSILAAAMGDVPDVAADNPAAVAALMADVPDAPGCDPLLAAALWGDPGDIANNAGGFVAASLASGSAISLTTSVAATVTSISLPPGDWDVAGQVCFTGATSTNVLWLGMSISTASASLQQNAGGFNIAPQFNLTPFSWVTPVSVSGGPYRVNATAGTVIYLVAESAFTASTCSAYGSIRARRAPSN